MLSGLGFLMSKVIKVIKVLKVIKVFKVLKVIGEGFVFLYIQIWWSEKSFVTL